MSHLPKNSVTTFRAGTHIKVDGVSYHLEVQATDRQTETLFQSGEHICKFKANRNIYIGSILCYKAGQTNGQMDMQKENLRHIGE